MKKHTTVTITEELLKKYGACPDGLATARAFLPAKVSTDPEQNIELALALVQTERAQDGSADVAWMVFCILDACGDTLCCEGCPPRLRRPGRQGRDGDRTVPRVDRGQARYGRRPMMHERVILERALEDREQKLVEACNEIAFWKTAAQRALEIMTARENVQEELRKRTLDACRWLKLWALEDTLAWQLADKLEKELLLEEGPCEAPGKPPCEG